MCYVLRSVRYDVYALGIQIQSLTTSLPVFSSFPLSLLGISQRYSLYPMACLQSNFILFRNI